MSSAKPTTIIIPAQAIIFQNIACGTEPRGGRAVTKIKREYEMTTPTYTAIPPPRGIECLFSRLSPGLSTIPKRLLISRTTGVRTSVETSDSTNGTMYGRNFSIISSYYTKNCRFMSALKIFRALCQAPMDKITSHVDSYAKERGIQHSLSLCLLSVKAQALKAQV